MQEEEKEIQPMTSLLPGVTFTNTRGQGGHPGWWRARAVSQDITTAVTKYCGWGRQGGFQWQTFLSCGSGSWGSKIQVPADSGSQFIVGAFSLGLYMLEGTPLPLTPNMSMYDSWPLAQALEGHGCYFGSSPQFAAVAQLLSHVRLFATPWTAAHQASLPSPSAGVCSNSSIESVKPSNHLILCRPLLFLLSIFPSIRVFSNQSALCIRWSKYWSFSFNISPSSEYSVLISFRRDWLDLLAVQGTLKTLL